MQKNVTKKITESSVLLALGTVLSFIKILDLPYGGSVTLCSMLPILLIAYRFGTGFGILGGFIYSVIQLLAGLKNLSYATSATAAVAIIMLDYILAFTVIGLGGIFKKVFKNQTVSITVGMAFVCILRYILHTISGCTVWAGLSIPTNDALIYSLGYNATYMLPELTVSVLVAFYIANSVDFGGENLTRIVKVKNNVKGVLGRNIGILALIAALVVDVLLVAAKLQNGESGAFDITGLADVNYVAMIIVSVVGVITFGVLFSNYKYKNKNN